MASVPRTTDLPRTGGAPTTESPPAIGSAPTTVAPPPTSVDLDIPLVPLALWNLLVLLILLSGLVTGGLAAILTLFGTGFQTGLTAATAVVAGIPMGTVILLIAPHALLEVPSLLLAGAIGLRGFALLLGSDDVWQSHYLPLVATASLLLLGGAIIEALGTPLLASLWNDADR